MKRPPRSLLDEGHDLRVATRRLGRALLVEFAWFFRLLRKFDDWLARSHE